MTAAPQTFQLASGQQLAGCWHGPLSHRPVLCLHGWLDNANSFVPLAAQLPHLPMLAIDLAGHGHSSHRSPNAHYYLFDYVSDLAQLCRQQGWQQLVLIGHSKGGMIATALAASFPELVRQLVLIDSLGFITSPEAEVATLLRKAILSREQSSKKQKPCYDSVLAAAQQRARHSDFDLSTAQLLSERGLVATTSGFQWAADVKLREVSAFRLSEAQARQLIRALQCPVLALMAQQSPAEIGQAKQQFQQDYPQLELKYLPGGHHLHMTEAALCAGAIRAGLVSDVWPAEVNPQA